MNRTIQFDEPQRVAVQHEVFDDNGDIEDSEWVRQRDTVTATAITHTDSVVTFENPGDGTCLLVSTENFITAWSEGVIQ